MGERQLQRLSIKRVKGVRSGSADSVDDRFLRALNDLRPKAPGKRASFSITQRLDDLATPAASIGVIHDFEAVCAHGFGRTANDSLQVSTTTIFQAGSISKLVFAVAVVRLVQDGLLDLDTDVNTYLTSWRVPIVDEWAPRITLRQLLSHTAGTTVHGFPGYPSGAALPSVRQILDGVPPANTGPVFVNCLPGLQCRYSGGGTLIAQQAVVDHLRKPFPKLMREVVLEPLGMTCSSYEQPPPPQLARNAATGHPWNRTPIIGGWHIYPEMAAAGLWATAEDLARFAVDFLRAWRGERSVLGLSQQSAAMMLRPQSSEQLDEYLGVGWFCKFDHGELRCGHRGDNYGFVAEIALFPTLGKGAVVLLNSNQGAPLRAEIFEALGREYGWPSEDRKTQSRLNPIDYSGSYCSSDGRILRIEQSHDTIQLNFDFQPPLLLSLTSEGKFSANLLDIGVEFCRNAEGEVTHAVLIQGLTTIAFRKRLADEIAT